MYILTHDESLAPGSVAKWRVPVNHPVLLALNKLCLQYESMSVQVTIRNVPEEVRDELASRAALQHQSMQEFLRGELARIASKPSVETWLQTVRTRKQASKTRVSASSILKARDSDRR